MYRALFFSTIKKSLIGLIFFSISYSFGQSVPRLTKVADELYDNHRYLEAIEFYDKIVGLDKKNYRARYRLGNSFSEALKYQEAEETFLGLGLMDESENTFRALSLYKYAAILKTDSKFEQADSLFAFVIEISNEAELIRLARKQKEGCQLALRQRKVNKGFSVSSLESVNSKYHDFGATINPGNQQLVFATTRNLGGTQYEGSQFEGVLPDLASYERVRDKWKPNSNDQRFDRLNSVWSEGSG
ncbi:MAG: tetratricopeptide repeat protein, partial [Bacteroidota bacterium]